VAITLVDFKWLSWVAPFFKVVVASAVFSETAKANGQERNVLEFLPQVNRPDFPGGSTFERMEP